MLPRVSLCRHDLESIELCHKEWGSQMLCVSRDVTLHRSGNTTISGILTISQSPSRVSLNLLHAYKGRPAACLWIMPIKPEIKFQRPNMVQIDFQSIETGESCSMVFTNEGFSSLFYSQLDKIQNQQKPARAQLQKKRLFGNFLRTKKTLKEFEQQNGETEKGVETAKFYPDFQNGQKEQTYQMAACIHVQSPEAPPRKDSFGRPEVFLSKPTPPPRNGSLPVKQTNPERGRPQLPKENKPAQPMPSKYDFVPGVNDDLMKEVWNGLQKANKPSLNATVPIQAVDKDPYQEERTHLAEEHDKLVVLRQEKGRRYQNAGIGNVRKQVLTFQENMVQRNDDIFEFRKNLRKTPNSSIILANPDRPKLLRAQINETPAQFNDSPAPSSIPYIPSVNLKQDPDSITPTQEDYDTPAPSSVKYQPSEFSITEVPEINDESFHSCRSEPSTITGSRSNEDGVPRLRSKVSGTADRFQKSASCVPSMSSMMPIPSIQASEISIDTITDRSLPENPKTDSGNETGSSKSTNNRLAPIDLRPKRSASLLSVNSFMDDIEIFYPSDIVHRRLLDSGGQANVFLASAKKFPQVAVKYFTCKDANDEQRVKEVVHTMRTSSHPHIVSIHGLVYNSPSQRELRKAPIGYLMEYVKSGSLHNLIHDFSNTYTTTDILDWIRQVTSALDHLHKRRIVHRDIKPQNMLWIDSTRTLKVCDLGLSASVDSIHTCELGTVYYMAPEVVESANYNELCDIYSLGITIWEMVHRRKPFFDISIGQMSFISRVKNDAQFRPSIDQKTDDLLKYLMMWCWKHDPLDRPSMDEVHDLVHGRLAEEGFYDDM